MFLKTAYKKEPVFAQSKTVFTAQQKQFEEKLSEDMFKMVLNSVPIKDKDLEPYGNDYDGLNYGACKYADVVIHGQSTLSDDIINDFKSTKSKKVVPYNTEWSEDISSLFEVYQTLAVD
ncbi:hypothetical protein FQZ97_1108520 [compost metagenome]